MFKVEKENLYDKALVPSIKGYKFEPRNKVKYDGVEVNSMIIINPNFINQVLRRKTKKKLEIYLQYLIDMLDDDDSDSGKISLVLNDLIRYKGIINNNYRVYLEKKYYDLLMKKIEVIENELRTKMMYIDIEKQKATEEKGKSR
ncbi:MAG: hypothetical protein PHD02_02225 [Bacilli bacterium]|nr:hypothetical protein [Bacilli bacterium]